MSTKILVFGGGSIGAVYTYILAQAIGTSNTTTVCRSNFSAALENGFTLNSSLFGTGLNVRPNVVSSVQEAVSKDLGPFDYVVICAKSLPTIPTIPDVIFPAISTSTTIVLIQNGIGIEDLYSQKFPSNPLLSCVVYLPATQTSPAVISHKEVEKLHIGTYPSAAPELHKRAAEHFASLIQNGGATALLHDDVQFERWSKLVVNASWNPICALSRTRDAEFLASSPSAAEYVQHVMLEIAAVAQAAGFPKISADLVKYQLGRAKARPLPGVEPSMLADALAGRQMEVDAIVGNTLRIAKDKQVNTPLLEGLFVLMSALDDSFTR